MTSPTATPDDGRPSTESRARLAAELHEQLAASRMAWDAALLRSDAALAAGDQAAADAALEDHRALLGVIEERLGAVVAAALVAREAEDVVRSAAEVEPVDEAPAVPRPAPGTAPSQAVDGSDRPVAEPVAGRRAVSSLLGAATAVALIAGVLTGDLRLDPRGSIAGSSTEGSNDLRTQVASERVTDALTGLDAEADTVGPRAELPAFSGSLPPSRTQPSAPTVAATSDEGTAPPPASPPAGAPDDDAPGVPTTPEQPDIGRIGELLGRLDARADDAAGDGGAVDDVDGDGDIDGDIDGDGNTSTPRPLGDLTERLREPATGRSASDPAGGLG